VNDGIDAAQAAYLDRIALDCATLLGPSATVERLEVTLGDAVVLRLRYRVGSGRGVIEGAGVGLVEAHAALVDRLRRDWLTALRAPRSFAQWRDAAVLVLGVAASTVGLVLVVLGPAFILVAQNLG
jgi:hypothetical protein